MSRPKVASVFLCAGMLLSCVSALRAAPGKHPSARIIGVAKNWRLHLKQGSKFPVGMELRMRLTGKKKGKVAEIRGKVTLPLGRKTCKLDVIADLGKGGYSLVRGVARLSGTLSVRKVQSNCSLPAFVAKKIKSLDASVNLSLRGSTLCPKGERPPRGACFEPDK